MSRHVAGLMVFGVFAGTALASGACGSSTFSSTSNEDGGSDGASSDAAASDAATDGGGIDGSSSDAGPDGIIAIVTGQKNPHDLLVFGGHVFWTNYAESGLSTVSSANVDGSEVKTIGEATHANRIATDGSRVFWTDMVSTNAVDSIIGAAPLDGGAGSILSTGFVAPMGIAADADHLYVASFYGFNSNGTIAVLDKTGLFQRNLASALDSPVSIAVDGSGIVWTVQGNLANSGQIVVSDLDGGILATTTNLSGPWGVTLASSNAYFTNIGSVDSTSAGSLGETSRAANASARTYAGNTRPRPYFITSDANDIYWTEEGNGPSNGGVRWAGNIDGVGSKDIASGQQRPHGIAVDADHVYWTSYGGGQIFRAPKPH